MKHENEYLSVYNISEENKSMLLEYQIKALKNNIRQLGVEKFIKNKNPPVNLVVFHITGKTLLLRLHEIVRSLTMPIANLSVIS